MTLDTTPINAALSRRKLLAAAGVVGAGLVATACGKSSEMRVSSPQPATPAKAATPTRAPAIPQRQVLRAPTADDVKIAQLAAGLEVLAVGTYQAALEAATTNKLGAVPPAVAEFVTVAGKHHQAHLDAWNKVLTDNGAAAVTEPNATLKPTVDATFAGVKDVAGAAMLALMLEQIAASTYLSAQSVLTDKAAIQLAGSIQVIDAQHVSILLYVLGQYPVPDVFARVDQAVAPGQAPSQAPAPAAPTGTMPATA